MKEIKRVLKPGGIFVVSTDIDGGVWEHSLISPIIRKSKHFSKEGSAYIMIKKVEEHRRKFKNYHASHVASLTYNDIKKLLDKHDFRIIRHSIYPLVGVPLRDIFSRIFPKKFRGDHQCIISEDNK